jgi:hypothetical protein
VADLDVLVDVHRPFRQGGELIILNGGVICQIVMQRLMKGESNLRRRDL